MEFTPPRRLSPSSIGTFTSCPLSYRFSYLQRLPEAPSAPASKGTLVHLALQHLMWRPPAERTIEHALADLARAREELAADPEFAELELAPDEWERFAADAEVLVRRYFELEDPTTIRPIGLEVRMKARLPNGVKVHGWIDRLELDADGELVVTDYKTGSSPSAGWEQRSLNGVQLYALLCDQMLGRLPARIQLLYLSVPERIVAVPTAQTVRGWAARAGAVHAAIETACTRDDFRPRTGPLCEYCSFREFCPAFGGDPDQAAPVLLARQAEREDRPQLPLAAV